jgi:hypothetical protein
MHSSCLPAPLQATHGGKKDTPATAAAQHKACSSTGGHLPWSAPPPPPLPGAARGGGRRPGLPAPPPPPSHSSCTTPAGSQTSSGGGISGNIWQQQYLAAAAVFGSRSRAAALCRHQVRWEMIPSSGRLPRTSSRRRSCPPSTRCSTLSMALQQEAQQQQQQGDISRERRCGCICWQRRRHATHVHACPTGQQPWL